MNKPRESKLILESVADSLRQDIVEIGHDMGHIAAQWLQPGVEVDQIVGEAHEISRLARAVIKGGTELRKIEKKLANPDSKMHLPFTREDYGDTILPAGSEFEVESKGETHKLMIGEKFVRGGGRTERLTPHRLFLLSYFLQHPGQPMSAADLVEAGFYPRDVSPALRKVAVTDSAFFMNAAVERILGIRIPYGSPEKRPLTKTPARGRKQPTTYTWTLPTRPINDTQPAEK